MVKTPEEAEAAAKELLGNTLVTEQTGEEGTQVNGVYVVDSVKVAKEMLFSLTRHIGKAKPELLLSPSDGRSIENIAKESPEQVFHISIDPYEGPKFNDLDKYAQKLGIPKNKVDKLAEQMQNMYNCFVAKDCNFIKIDPLVLTEDGFVLALDAKVAIDDGLSLEK